MPLKELIFIVRTKIACEYCGRPISKSNYSKHIRTHQNGNFIKYQNQYKLDHSDLYCKFCGKECKNTNSLVQHEIRCRMNPDKIEINNSLEQYNKLGKSWNRGLTKETDSRVARHAKSISMALQNRKVIYVYTTHNQTEIEKWKNYVSSIDIQIPEYEVRQNQGYNILKEHSHYHTEGTHYIFEHDYIMNIVFDGKLSIKNTVHHIDNNGFNNDIHNLMVFKTKGDHIRFHLSDYAYLLYNETTHLFTCIVKKDIE